MDSTRIQKHRKIHLVKDTIKDCIECMSNIDDYHYKLIPLYDKNGCQYDELYLKCYCHQCICDKSQMNTTKPLERPNIFEKKTRDYSTDILENMRPNAFRKYR